MKMFSKMMVVGGLMLGGLLFSTQASAQNPQCTGAKPANGHACCASKTAATTGGATSTSANGGSTAAKTSCSSATAAKPACAATAAKSCSHQATKVSAVSTPATPAVSSQPEGTK